MTSKTYKDKKVLHLEPARKCQHCHKEKYPIGTPLGVSLPMFPGKPDLARVTPPRQSRIAHELLKPLPPSISNHEECQIKTSCALTSHSDRIAHASLCLPHRLLRNSGRGSFGERERSYPSGMGWQPSAPMTPPTSRSRVDHVSITCRSACRSTCRSWFS